MYWNICLYTNCFILYCARLIVSLAAPKLLALDNKNKKDFILYCARLIVTLH